MREEPKRENADIAPTLKHVDPSRRRGAIYRIYARFANTRLGRWLSVRVLWKLDPIVMRLSGGRLGLGLMLPTALLETRGARSGKQRLNGVLYFNDGETIVIAASKLGLPEDPSWLHNLRTNPDVTLGEAPMRASVVGDAAERERLWQLADRVFPPFADYRERAARSGREIQLVRLVPRK